jgi:hypothetical protein
MNEIHFDEVVIFKESQVVPLYVITFQSFSPPLLNSSVPMKSSQPFTMTNVPIQQAPPETVLAKALRNFQAASGNELNFSKGDILEIIAKHDNGWWFASLKGKRGLIPRSFVELIPSSDVSGIQVPITKPQLLAQALYNFQATFDNELSFSAGDILEIINQNDNGWWYASLKGKFGFIPDNFVKLM